MNEQDLTQLRADVDALMAQGRPPSRIAAARDDGTTRINVQKAAHGFTVGKGVYLSGSTWVVIDGTSINYNSQLWGIVSKVRSSSRFVVTVCGSIFLTGAYTSSAYGFTSSGVLSDSASVKPIKRIDDNHLFIMPSAETDLAGYVKRFGTTISGSWAYYTVGTTSIPVTSGRRYLLALVGGGGGARDTVTSSSVAAGVYANYGSGGGGSGGSILLQLLAPSASITCSIGAGGTSGASPTEGGDTYILLGGSVHNAKGGKYGTTSSSGLPGRGGRGGETGGESNSFSSSLSFIHGIRGNTGADGRTSVTASASSNSSLNGNGATAPFSLSNTGGSYRGAGDGGSITSDGKNGAIYVRALDL